MPSLTPGKLGSSQGHQHPQPASPYIWHISGEELATPCAPARHRQKRCERQALLWSFWDLNAPGRRGPMMPKGFGKGRGRGRSSRTPSLLLLPFSRSGRLPGGYLARWMVGLEVRTEAAAGGGGGGVGAGWDLSAEAGPGPGLGGGRSSDPGSETRHSQGRRCPAGQRGAPRLPPGAAPRGNVGGPTPALARRPPPRPAGVEGEPAGERIPAASRSLITQKAESTGLGQQSRRFALRERSLGKAGGEPRAGWLQQAGQHPRASTSPWELSLFGMHRPGKSRLEVSQQGTGQSWGCPAGPAGSVRCRRRGGGSRGSTARPPPPDPLGAASRAPRQRGGCAAAPAPAHGSRSPATLSPAPCLSFAFPAPLAFEPPPAPGVLSACQLIPFSPEGFVPSRAPARRFPARRGAP